MEHKIYNFEHRTGSSVALKTFVLLYGHNIHPSPGFSHLPKLRPCAHQTSHSPVLPAPGNHSLLSASELNCKDMTQVKSHSICPSVSCIPHSSSLCPACTTCPWYPSPPSHRLVCDCTIPNNGPKVQRWWSGNLSTRKRSINLFL